MLRNKTYFLLILKTFHNVVKFSSQRSCNAICIITFPTWYAHLNLLYLIGPVKLAKQPHSDYINLLLSGVPDFFDRNKILSGYDLSHYQVPHCIRVFFYFARFVFIHHNFQFYFELCTYCNILDIYLSQNLNFANYLLFYMKLLNYLFFNMFGSVLECCELTGVSLLWPWLIKWK